MIVMRIMGGMGNQMFQYALAYRLKSIGHRVKLDLSFFDCQKEEGIGKRKYALDCFENIDIKVSSKAECQRYNPQYSSWFVRHSLGEIQKLLNRIPALQITKYAEREPYYEFHKELFSLKRAYLSGYWQNHNYFEKIRPELLKVFSFKPPVNLKNSIAKKTIQAKESVSVHIRRGDYLNFKDIYGEICTINYYMKAIEYIKKTVKNPHFYFFSDEPNWIRENFNLSNMTVIDWNSRDDASYDMYLMSKCKHNIIANSTFSWWAAWLNKNPKKIVISPSKYDSKTNITDDKKLNGYIYL